MLSQIPLSKTKMFFQTTIQSVKSFFGGATYQRLPKTLPFKPFSCIGIDKKFSQNYKELHNTAKNTKKKKKKKVHNFSCSTPTKASKRGSKVCDEDDYDHQVEKRHCQKKKRMSCKAIEKEDKSTRMSKCDDIRGERKCLVAKKLKEIEVMDLSNVENVLDIEEVIHYYSRLTCPAYLDIFDKFFMNVYSDLFNLKAVAHHSKPTSRLRIVAH